MSKRTSEDTTNPGLTYNVPLAIGLGGLVTWFLYAFYVRANFHEKDRDAIGAFGDAFGAINPLLTIVAIVGAFFAVMYQREELRQAKFTLESEKKKSESEKIERHFFMLLDLLESSEMKVRVPGAESGLPSFAAINNLVTDEFNPPSHSSLFSDAFPHCEGWLRVFKLLVDQIHKLAPSERPFLVAVLQSQLANEQFCLLCHSLAYQNKWLKGLAPVLHEIGFIKCLQPYIDAKSLLFVWNYLRSQGYEVTGREA